jgi:hypothetical protein
VDLKRLGSAAMAIFVTVGAWVMIVYLYALSQFEF